MPALALMTFVWAVTWMIVLVGGVWFHAGAAALVFGLAAIIFGLGECLHGPTQGALVADLAPPRLRGRYMALSTLRGRSASQSARPRPGSSSTPTERARPIASFVCVLAGCGALLLEQQSRRAPRYSVVAPKPPPPGVSIRRTSPAARSASPSRAAPRRSQVAARLPGLPARAPRGLCRGAPR